jgi:signal transduction histidine kinase
MISSSNILGARILVVDDQEANVRLLERMLSGAGYVSIASTTDPHEVCELHRRNSYDLILLDLLMPGMDGFQVMEGLKEIENDGYLPVLVITAQPDHKLRALQAGAKDFISKPIDLADVLTRVHNMLEVRLLHVETRNNSKVLEQTVERLKEVERLKNGFLLTVSHELRTPLTSIRGSLGLLASGAVGALSDEVVEIVAIAERNAVRLMALIDDILDLERLETGKIELQFAPIPVEPILRRAIESVATFGQRDGVTVEAPEVSSMIWADADRIVQVLVNLLSNAVKFSPPGGVVTIGVEPRGSWVEFRVTDRGRGVPVAHRRSIFERFRQVQTSDAREKGGTGLGLAICKSIIEQHGGTIGVESEEGGGTSFWFRVASSSRLFAPGVEQPILVCGDRRGMFEEVLREAGYAVITASTDDAAWEMLRRTRVSAVLMKSDSDLIARLRKDPALHRMPAVLFGNPAMLGSEALSDSLVLVLPQRVDSREFLVTIRDSLERGRVAALMSGPESVTRS